MKHRLGRIVVALAGLVAGAGLGGGVCLLFSKPESAG
jgi:hypothetical protein